MKHSILNAAILLTILWWAIQPSVISAQEADPARDLERASGLQRVLEVYRSESSKPRDRQNFGFYRERMRSIAATLPIVRVDTGRRAAAWQKLKMNSDEVGVDAFRFVNPLQERADLYWAFAVRTPIQWGIVRRAGIIQPFKVWRRVLDLKVQGVEVPRDYTAFFQPLLGGEILPGEEYIVWFIFPDERPADVFLALRLVPAGSLQVSSTHTGIASALGWETPLRLNLKKTNFKVTRE